MATGRMLYFAYGSNMCGGRLVASNRVPSACAITVGRIAGHSLRWHKLSNDGSGKADAYFTGIDADAVLGVLFEIDGMEKPALDRAEGLGSGYVEKKVVIEATDGAKHMAVTYVADDTHIDDSLKPYTWYKRFVVEGAKKHGLEPRYIRELEEQPATRDHDVRREKREMAIGC